MYHKLIPLKIPSGWVVIHNTFGDEEPKIEDGTIINDEFYNENLLSIEQMYFDGQNWQINPQGYILDLGWYPEANPEGCYRLTLLKSNWENIIAEVESKKHEVIQYFIKRCFNLILQGIEERQIAELITQDLEKAKPFGKYVTIQL